jgi:hypothetical protein
MSLVHSESNAAHQRRFLLRSKRMANMNPEEEYRVVMTRDGVACEHPRRKREFVAWDEIGEIRLVTTDDGPLLPDVWLLLGGRQGGCSVPQGAVGYDELYDRVSQFPGFDFESVIKASVCTDNAEFMCWRRSDSFEHNN